MRISDWSSDVWSSDRAARFGAVLFDNLRNAIFERVGQDAARRLSVDVFSHIRRLSLRFHLERHTEALTKIVERGTKRIDTLLYRTEERRVGKGRVCTFRSRCSPCT